MSPNKKTNFSSQPTSSRRLSPDRFKKTYSKKLNLFCQIRLQIHEDNKPLEKISSPEGCYWGRAASLNGLDMGADTAVYFASCLNEYSNSLLDVALGLSKIDRNKEITNDNIKQAKDLLDGSKKQYESAF